MSSTDGVVEIELSGEIPFSVVGVLTTDVVGVESEESLVGRHTGRSRVELDHEEIKDVSRGVYKRVRRISD